MASTSTRLASQMADAIRLSVLHPHLKLGEYLPSERVLADRLGASRVTIRRALRQLVSEGLIEPIPSHGYRRTRAAAGARVPGLVAYVLTVAEPHEMWDFSHEQILAAINRRLMDLGRQTLAVGCRGRRASEVFAELCKTHVRGVVLDSSEVDYVQTALDAGIPFVVVDAHSDLLRADVVMQDNFNGARLAAAHLVAAGHKRIAWLGPTQGLPHYRERFAGARAALSAAGLDFVPGSLPGIARHDAVAEAEALVTRLLRARHPPTAVVCMWQVLVMAAARAIRHARLQVGKDVELVAWGTEQDYLQLFAPEFLDGEAPATVVWRPEDMARVAIERLDARAAHADAPAVRTDVKVRLIPPTSAEMVIKRGIPPAL
jgi:DNA-binding LacI/PurR family transcriptional regulator